MKNIGYFCKKMFYKLIKLVSTVTPTTNTSLPHCKLLSLFWRSMIWYILLSNKKVQAINWTKLKKNTIKKYRMFSKTKKLAHTFTSLMAFKTQSSDSYLKFNFVLFSLLNWPRKELNITEWQIYEPTKSDQVTKLSLESTNEPSRTNKDRFRFQKDNYYK